MQRSSKLPSWLERNWQIILLGVVIAILYLPMFNYWLDGWLNKTIGTEHEYFSHALIGFPYAAYVVFKNRQQWAKLPDTAHPLGIVLLIVSAIFYITGVPEFAFISFPLLLTSLCLCFKGIEGLRLQWFPLILVFLGTPNSIPYLITPFTLPLQKFIANVAGFILMQAGFNVSVSDIYLRVNGQSVEVAPYCAGLKMLFTSLYVTLMLLHWTGTVKKVKKVIFMLLGAIFISVSANIVRNTFLAMFHGLGKRGAFDSLHEGTGGDIYSAIMLLCIVGLNQWVNRNDSSAKLAKETVNDDE
ncbi:MAG: cyanoexosortase B [Microcystaceae cyanobacterium]